MCSLARRGKQTSLKLQGGHKESSYNCQSLNTTKEKPNVLPWDNKKSTPRARHHSWYPSLHQRRLSKGTEPINRMYIFIIKVGLLDLSVQQRLGTIVAVCALEMQGTQQLLSSRRGTSQKYSLNVESLEVPWSPWSTLEGRERSRMSQKSSIAWIDTPTQEAEGRQVYTCHFAPRSLYHGHIRRCHRHGCLPILSGNSLIVIAKGVSPR